MQSLMINWFGRSGLKYTAETHLWGTEFLPLSAVYIACAPTWGGWLALYVGETHDINQRLNTGAEGHNGLKRARASGATHFGICLVSDNAERLRIETDLRHGLNPSCNMQPVNSLARSLFDL